MIKNSSINSIFSLLTSSALFLSLTFTVVFQSVAEQKFSSGEQQVPLIELYTSEGCSSCPPADRWMSTLVNDEALWSGFVPIALHVDYWDYIGWKDPYASPEYSQRQRQIAAENRERTVYTPGVRKAGQEWRTWRLWGEPSNDKGPLVGDLSLSVDNSGAFNAKFNQSDDQKILSRQGLQLNIAVLGLGLSNEVTRGENRGETLEHDFVVLGLSRFSSAEEFSWSGSIEKPEISADRYALAAWISEKGRTKPIQSTGGYLNVFSSSQP